MKKKNQNIKCNVDSCRYNDCDHNACCLDEIKVGCCGCDNPNCREDTACDSFEEKKSN